MKMHFVSYIPFCAVFCFSHITFAGANEKAENSLKASGDKIVAATEKLTADPTFRSVSIILVKLNGNRVTFQLQAPNGAGSLGGDCFELDATVVENPKFGYDVEFDTNRMLKFCQ